MSALRRVLIIVLYTLIFWLILPAALLGLGSLADRLPVFGWLPGWARWLGVPLLALGAWLCGHAALLLRTIGKGLPISSLPPTQYVTSGPYRLFTHPIYTGYALLVAGLGLLLESPGTALVVAPLFALLWFNTWVRLYEEPLLEQRFGAVFRARRARTAHFLPLDLRRPLRWLVLWGLRRIVRLKVEGGDRIPRYGPVVLICDHGCYLDFLFGLCVTRRDVLVPVTAEVYRKSLVAAFISLMGGVPKRRFCADPAAAQVLSDQLLAGEMVGIAIEGERSWTGRMSLPAASVARSIGRFECLVVPFAIVGSYRFWPRWAAAPDRSQPITLRVGKPFLLREALPGFVPGAAEQAPELARLLRARISALRDPYEERVDIGAFRGARPQLALWRCPCCGAEEELRWAGALSCGACSARWEAADGGLRLVEGECSGAAEDSLAGWVARAGGVPSLDGRSDPLLAADAELREEPHAQALLGPLHSLGPGRVELGRDGLRWRGGERERLLPLKAIRSVTTERNDTLQLGLGRGVAQLVFAESSPWRWQGYVLALRRR